MWFLCCFIPIFALAFDFVVEIDYIYKLDSSDFDIKNNILTIRKIDTKDHTQQNTTLNTESSKLVFDTNLKYYYHTNRFSAFREDLVELVKEGDSYTANIKSSDYKHCFVIAKVTSHKILSTKSSAMLLNIDELDSNNDKKLYVGCLANKRYIY